MDSIVDAVNATWISFSCPMCGIENRCRLVDVALQDRVYCPGCHGTIQLVDKDASAAKAFGRVSSAVDHLRGAFKRIK
jgi:hypothetical protein